MTLNIKTTDKRQVIDITTKVEELLKGGGLVNIFLKHTTAAITTADLDPGTDKDYLSAFESITPKIQWSHPHNPAHFPDHFWSTVIGPAISLPFIEGQLDLGTWQ